MYNANESNGFLTAVPTAKEESLQEPLIDPATVIASVVAPGIGGWLSKVLGGLSKETTSGGLLTAQGFTHSPWFAKDLSAAQDVMGQMPEDLALARQKVLDVLRNIPSYKVYGGR